MASCSSPGNLFLFGEHAVVYGKPVIITSVNLRVDCKIKSLSQEKIKISSKELGEALLTKKKRGRKDLFILLDLCQDLLLKFKIKKGLDLIIKSGIPVASGLSSSTATLCSILGAFSKLFNLGIKPENYYNHLIKYQKIIHGGKASGVEIISSSQGGFNYVSFKKKLRIKKLGKCPFKIVIGDSGIKTKTAKTVKNFIPKLMKKSPKLVLKSFDKIEELTNEGLKAVLKQDLIKMGRLVNENQIILSRLGLSHPRLDRGIKAALNAGAYGAKLSGKGQGGVMFALVNQSSQERVAKAIKNAGLKVIITKIGIEGIK